MAAEPLTYQARFKQTWPTSFNNFGERICIKSAICSQDCADLSSAVSIRTEHLQDGCGLMIEEHSLSSAGAERGPHVPDWFNEDAFCACVSRHQARKPAPLKEVQQLFAMAEAPPTVVPSLIPTMSPFASISSATNSLVSVGRLPLGTKSSKGLAIFFHCPDRMKVLPADPCTWATLVPLTRRVCGPDPFWCTHTLTRTQVSAGPTLGNCGLSPLTCLAMHC